MVRIGVVGCAHGQFDAIYARIDEINEAAVRSGDAAPVELLLCCGDVQSLRNRADLECEACPRRYKHMNEFHEYYCGTKKASVLTIVIGGNHEASNFFHELHYGGWIAPNMFYLGAAGVVNVLGLRIAGLSGIYDPDDYKRGHYERAPYTKKSMYSVFHTRESEVFQLSHLTGSIDIVLSHDWPRKIEDHGDKHTLVGKRPSFQTSIDMDHFGSRGGETLLHLLKPKYWFSGHMHVRFEATVLHHESEADTTTAPTQFLALDKCLPNRPWLEIVEIAPSTPMESTDSDNPRVCVDVEWLAILRATHHVMSRSPNDLHLPAQLLPIDESDLSWVQRRLNDSTSSARQVGEWPASFQITAPSLSDENFDRSVDGELGNPQTDAILQLLQLSHVLTSPYRPEALVCDDSESRESGSDEEWDMEGNAAHIADRKDDNDAFLESLDSFSFTF